MVFNPTRFRKTLFEFRALVGVSNFVFIPFVVCKATRFLSMARQIIFTLEFLVTQRATEWSLICMNSHVTFQSWWPRKFRVTYLTHWYIPLQVNKCLVLQKFRFSSCFAWTILTTESQTFMNCFFVRSQRCCMRKNLLAVFTWISHAVVMSFNVCLQCLFLLARISAFLTLIKHTFVKWSFMIKKCVISF